MNAECNPVVPDPAADANVLERVDVAIAQEAGELRENPAVRVLGTLSELADQPPLIALSAGTLAVGLLTRRRRLAVTGGRMLASHLLATGVKALIKRSVDRTRPQILVEENRYETGRGEHNEHDYNSFPSGHTAGAVAVAQAIARDRPGAAATARGLAALVALVQMPRCKHYLSDVLVGAAIGLASEAVASRALDRGLRMFAR